MPGALGPAAPLLDVRALETHFATRAGVVKAVDGLSFGVPPGASVGIVGELGSGKSAAALSIMGLIDPPGFIAGGEILFKGKDIARLPEREFRRLRGREICLVFQDPMAALNPVYTVGAQLREALSAHTEISRAEARNRAVELLRLVGIPAPERRVHEYPHRLSGGMRQRVTIAIGLANNPDLLILDEPTTALDVTIQAQILDLLEDLRRRTNAAVLLISHDFGVVREICEQVVVMYGGRAMERGTVSQVTEDPKHPYTAGLLASIPTPAMRGRRLNAIGGAVANPLAMPPGCPFRPRCPRAMDICTTVPVPRHTGGGREVSCWLY